MRFCGSVPCFTLDLKSNFIYSCNNRLFKNKEIMLTSLICLLVSKMILGLEASLHRKIS